MLKQKYGHIFTHEHVYPSPPPTPTSANTDGKKAVSEAEFSEYYRDNHRISVTRSSLVHATSTTPNSQNCPTSAAAEGTGHFQHLLISKHIFLTYAQ